MAELIEYKDSLYRLFHPNLRTISEMNSMKKGEVSDELREKGIIRIISDIFAELMWKQRERVQGFDSLQAYYSFDREQINVLEIEMLTDDVIYDESNGLYYIYFNKGGLPLTAYEYFDSSWVIYDGENMRGVSYMTIDMSKTNEVSDHTYYYRLYVGSSKLLKKEQYYLFKPSLLHYLGKNKGMPLHLLNSFRVNTSLLNNASKFFTNKPSFLNLQEVGMSLEADVDIESYSVVPESYLEVVEEYKGILSSEYLATMFKSWSIDKKGIQLTRTLLKGHIFSLRFEDFRIDYLSELESIVITSKTDVFDILDGINEDKVIKEFDTLNASLYPAGISYDNSMGVVSFNVNKFDSESIFFKRIGLTDRWFLKLNFDGSDYIYDYVIVSNGVGYDIELRPLFYDVADFNGLGDSLFELIGTGFESSDKYFYYEYYYYPPVSLSSHLIDLSIRNEVNSSFLKILFDVYKYNKKIIDLFLPDDYEIFSGYVEFNGERTLF